MATFTEDWSGHTPGAAPTGYTAVGQNIGTPTVQDTGLPSGVLGAQALRIAGSLANTFFNWSGLINTSVLSDGATEVLTRWYLPAKLASSHLYRLFGGASHYGTSTAHGAGTLMWSGGEYSIYAPSDVFHTQYTAIAYGTSGLYSSMNSLNDATIDDDVWMWSRHRFDPAAGTYGTGYSTIWLDGDAEPGSWDVTGALGSDKGLDADGATGLFWSFYNDNSATVDTLWCDWFSVGTNGDTAPSPGPTYVDGAFSMSAAASMSVAGVRSPAVGVFSMSAAAGAAIAGVRTPAVGAFSMNAAAALDITGVRTPAVGVFGMSAAAAMSFAGSVYAPQPVAYTLTAASRGTVALSASTTGTRTLAAASRGTVALEARS